MKIKLNLSIIIIGLTSMIGQILILRELIIVFYGNELSLGIILACWLFWVSFGSLFLGRITDYIRDKLRSLCISQVFLSFILPLNLFLIRNIKNFLNISAGQMLGFLPMLFSSFLLLAPICIILGFCFTLISKLASETGRFAPREIARIYILEALGASIGGLLYGYLLVKILSPSQIAFLVSAFNILISIIILPIFLNILFFVAISLAFLFNIPEFIEDFSKKFQWKEFMFVESHDSIYGNIAVMKVAEEYSFYENGLLLFSTGDLLSAEESVHYSLLQHPKPKKILLIGGGISGALEQILKHNIEKIDYIELDPQIIKTARKFLPENYLWPLENRLINIEHMDGRLFVKRKASWVKGQWSRVKDARYDVVIVNLPDPYTAMLNRFYSLEFFREVKKILKPGGIISFGLTSSENYINPEQQVYLSCIYNTLKNVFKEAKVFPGDYSIFFGCDIPGRLTTNPDILIQRLKERNLKLQFVREYYLPFKLSGTRVKYVEDSINAIHTPKINSDLKPIGYFYHSALWMSQFLKGKNLIEYLEKIDFLKLLILLLILSLALLIIQRFKKGKNLPVVISIGTTGFSEMLFQVVVLISFQFIYGYVYYKLSIILTSFMIGLVLGGLFINKLLENLKNERGLYLKTQIFIVLYPLILPLIFLGLIFLGEKRPELAQKFEASFTFLPIIAGFIGGFQFPLANKICLKDSKEVGKITGLLYGVDLFGACLGGLLSGIILIPILGIIQTCILVAVLNFLVLILLILTGNFR